MNAVVPITRQQPAVSFSDMERLAESVAKSGLFGMKTKEQALSLMAIAQAEGRHPALAARDYDIIQGRSAKKSEAMLRDFIESGGKVEWHKLDDANADATFSHPSGGSVRITWDMERVKNAGLLGKDMYKKYPRQMLRSRAVSEGVRTVYPAATSGMYVPEEVADFDTRPIKDVTPAASPIQPAAPRPPFDPKTGEVKPHQIQVGYITDNDGYDQSDWVGWGRDLIAGIKTAATPAELSGWIDANQAALASCAENAPKAYKSVTGAIEAQKTKLSAPVVEGEAETVA